MKLSKGSLPNGFRHFEIKPSHVEMGTLVTDFEQVFAEIQRALHSPRTDPQEPIKLIAVKAQIDCCGMFPPMGIFGDVFSKNKRSSFRVWCIWRHHNVGSDSLRLFSRAWNWNHGGNMKPMDLLQMV